MNEQQASKHFQSLRVLLNVGVVIALTAAVLTHLGPIATFFHNYSEEPQRKAATIIALWVIFSLYWGIEARTALPTMTAEPRLSVLIHTTLWNAAVILLMLPITGLTQRLLPDTNLFFGVGIGIHVASILFAVWARRHLGRNWSGDTRIAVSHELIKSGPYRFLRHPIYTAIVGMFIADTLAYSAELHTLIAIVLISIVYWRKIKIEEKALRQAFGAEYEAYVRETWALIPFVF